MENVSRVRQEDNQENSYTDGKIADRMYRAKAATVAYARPDGAAMIQLEENQLIIGRPAVEPDWLAWIEDGDVIGYLRLGDLELCP